MQLSAQADLSTIPDEAILADLVGAASPARLIYEAAGETLPSLTNLDRLRLAAATLEALWGAGLIVMSSSSAVRPLYRLAATAIAAFAGGLILGSAV